MRIIGIDPGKAGGIAFIDGENVTAVPMPDTPKDIYDYLLSLGKVDLAVLEKVGAMPGDGGAAMFQFGKGVGHLEMALLAAGIRCEQVTPVKWMGDFNMRRKGGESRPQWKNRLKALAQRLFPNVNVTLKTTDALLIAEWGRRNFYKQNYG